MPGYRYNSMISYNYNGLRAAVGRICKIFRPNFLQNWFVVILGDCAKVSTYSRGLFSVVSLILMMT